jgi:5-methylcytosine-specific restriction endonuclease McrA
MPWPKRATRKDRDREAYNQELAALGGNPKPTPQRIQDAAERSLAKFEHQGLVQRILQHANFICWAYGVSPVCTKWATEPHELIPRGAGGKVSLANSVATCRACHNAAQGRVGGLKLVATWGGKDEGRPPRADLRGFVRPIWRRKAV